MAVQILVLCLQILSTLFRLTVVSTMPTESAALVTREYFDLPVVRLGFVELKPWPECEKEMSFHLSDCDQLVIEDVQSALQSSNDNPHTETVKRAACCSAWHAKKCLVVAANSIESCPANISVQYSQLPSDRKIAEHVYDLCSEYGEQSEVCNYELKHSNWFNLRSLTTILISLLIITVCALALMKLYLDKKRGIEVFFKNLSQFNVDDYKNPEQISEQELYNIINDNNQHVNSSSVLVHSN